MLNAGVCLASRKCPSEICVGRDVLFGLKIILGLLKGKWLNCKGCAIESLEGRKFANYKRKGRSVANCAQNTDACQ
jgi:hypothetical protein